MTDTDLDHFLERVQSLNNQRRTNWLPTHRNIWAGSYDVWNCQQDYIDATERPRAAVKKAIDAGLVYSEEVNVGKYTNTVYRLTELGQAYMQQQQFERELQQ